MKPLTSKQRQHLKALAHPLSSIVQVGKNGITNALEREVDQALNDHELIKVQVLDTSPTDRESAATLLANKLSAVVLGQIGRVIILYRQDEEEPQIKLP